MLNTNILLMPYKLNPSLTLKNRMIMAPMTRNAADDNFVPSSASAAYYARRADAGLIVTEGTIIRPDARGYSNVPGIYTEAQIKGWKQVTDAVHANNGLIFCQLWHVGRVSHPNFLGGALPVSASDTQMQGPVKRVSGWFYGKARELRIDEISEIIESYAKAAQNAIKAGFDGIELHGANGYLIDQFLHHDTNHRADYYGGSVENMARFALDIVKACGDLIGYERVGLRLSPGAYLNEIIGDVRDAGVFAYLLQQLNQMHIAYVHTGNFDDERKFPELGNKGMTTFMRTHYAGTLIACGGYTLEKARAAMEAQAFDLIAIGKSFIANPDLVSLTKNHLPLRSYDASMLDTLY